MLNVLHPNTPCHAPPSIWCAAKCSFVISPQQDYGWDADHILNLYEVTLYRSTDAVPSAELAASLSSTWSDGIITLGVGNCFDGDTIDSEPTRACATGSFDPKPTLTVEYTCANGLTDVTSVGLNNVVTSGYGERINRFKAEFYDASGAQSGSTTMFSGGLAYYTITP